MFSMKPELLAISQLSKPKHMRQKLESSTKLAIEVQKKSLKELAAGGIGSSFAVLKAIV